MLGVIPDYGWVWPKKQKAKKKKPNLTMFSKDAFSLLWMETLSFFLLRHSTKILGEKKSIIKIQEVVLLQNQEKCKTLLPSFTFILYMIRLFTYLTVCAYI